MKHHCSTARRAASGRTRAAGPAAVFLALLAALVLASGCGGETPATSATSIASASLPTAASTTSTETAVTEPAVAQTTSSTLSLHDRVQQEQAQQEAQSSGSTAPAVRIFDVEAGKTLVMGNGTRLSSQEVEDLNAYAVYAENVQREQERLCAQFDLLMNRTHQWEQADYNAFKSLITGERGLLNRLGGATVPKLYRAAHDERARAAEVFAEAWQKVLDGDPGGTPTKDAAAVNLGLEGNRRGIETWHSAENMTQSVAVLVKSGDWE